jgi:hypothetical protein
VRRPAFVTNYPVIVIAVVGVWIALALPIYAHGLRFLAKRGAAGVGTRVLMLIIAGLAPWLLLKMLLGVEWLAERLGRFIGGQQRRNHRG